MCCPFLTKLETLIFKTLLALMDMIFNIISVLKHSLITATLKPPDPNLPIVGPFRPFNTFGMLLLDLEPKMFPGTPLWYKW